MNDGPALSWAMASRPSLAVVWPRTKGIMMADKTHRDEIHNDVRYDPLAVALLDTPALQRLGRVYQLGYGHLVYRGATHTRLSHAMGTYHTASRLVDAVRRNYESAEPRPIGAIDPGEFLPQQVAADEGSGDRLPERWEILRCLVSWAGLLHDVGHVPLGHTLEDEFDGIYEKHDDFWSPRLRYLWLDPRSDITGVLRQTDLYPEPFKALGIADGNAVALTVLLICTWKERVGEGRRTTFEEILDEHVKAVNDAVSAGELEASEREDRIGIASDLRAAMRAFCPSLFSPYMADIVANTISADYLDYLRRDPHNLGLDVLKDDRVVSRFWVGRDHRGQARMALTLVDRRGKKRLDTCTGVVDLVRQRYRFAEIVYYHKTKVSASAMLAKVFHLVGAPPELPESRTRFALRDIATRVNAAFDAGDSSRLSIKRALIRESTPTALLDPEIGDEGLGLLLRQRAIEQLEDALRKRDRADDDDQADRQRAIDALTSIALLDGLARRELYKTAFTVSPEQYPVLRGMTGTPVENVERELTQMIGELRHSASARADLESAMIAAAGWEPGSMLLYVPGRKSQAKGILTGALAPDGEVITLGTHPAVRGQVDELSKQYASLWRLIILVHPDHAHDVLGLSRAIEEFMKTQFGDRTYDGAVVDALRECCWFPFVPHRDRGAAQRFLDLAGGATPTSWQPFVAYCARAEHGGNEEVALSAALVARMASLVGDKRALKRVLDLGPPSAVQERVVSERSRDLASAALTGAADVDAETRALQRALDQLAADLASETDDA